MSKLVEAWYRKSPWLWLLWPLSKLFELLVNWRRQRDSAQATNFDVPVLVVGNITVGGTGKTPLLIALCEHLQKKGMKPGVISRGYGANSKDFPLHINEDTTAAQAGDEPILIAEKTGCPVVIDPNRVKACKSLLDQHQVDIVLSDDGLQHYRLARHIEIAVVDGERLFGNGLCLPAGPLREPVSRLQEVDFVVVNGGEPEQLNELPNAHPMQLRLATLTNLQSGERKPASGAPFTIGTTLQAVAAIGNPNRFFKALESLPYPVRGIAFPDHHQFQPADFAAPAAGPSAEAPAAEPAAAPSGARDIDPNQPIVMTEKDAVKCRDFATANMWEVQTRVELPANFLKALDTAIKNR